jgi:hypothetical protein
MSSPDPVFARLTALPVLELEPKLSKTVRAAAVARLRPRPIHPAWTLAVIASGLTYLGWALHFAASLY